MAKSMDCQAAPGAIEQIGARSHPETGGSLSVAYTVDWTFGPGSDREAGNACVGIAIGCALSLPIWLGVAASYYLLF